MSHKTPINLKVSPIHVHSFRFSLLRAIYNDQLTQHVENRSIKFLLNKSQKLMLTNITYMFVLLDFF